VLQDMFFKLRKSESVQEQKKAEIFSRRHNFATLVQVIKDENQPELEGKILTYRFGKKLWEKIQAELKPIMGEPHNPFDLLAGKAFHLKITKVSGFNNYDQSKVIAAVTGQAPATNNMADVQAATHSSNPTSTQTPSSGITSEEISLDDLNTGSSPQMGSSDMPSIDLPDLPDVGGDLGDLDDVMKGL
jgi:hypothetical protein